MAKRWNFRDVFKAKIQKDRTTSVGRLLTGALISVEALTCAAVIKTGLVAHLINQRIKLCMHAAFGPPGQTSKPPSTTDKPKAIWWALR